MRLMRREEEHDQKPVKLYQTSCNIGVSETDIHRHSTVSPFFRRGNTTLRQTSRTSV